MILIWANTGEWGGVTVLLMRFAEFLRDRGVGFAVVEPEGSRLRTELPWIKFLTVDEVSAQAERYRYLFLPSVAAIRDEVLPWDRLADARVFGWIVQPLDPLSWFVPTASPLIGRFGGKAIRPVLLLWRRHVRLVSGLFATLVRGNGVAAMDEVAARALPFYYPAVPKPRLIIPIPAPVDGLTVAAHRAEPGRVVIGYLGRMDAVKFTGVGAFVRHNLAEIARLRRVELIAVTEGSHVPALEEACRAAGVELRVTGYLPNTEARRLIRTETDLAIAMGTSALDIAAMGHPCIVIDTSLAPRAAPQRLFRFVHEGTDHNLGEYRDFPIYVGGKHSLPEIVDLVERGGLGDPAMDYVRREHDPERRFADLLDAIWSSEVTAADIAGSAMAITRSIKAIHRLYGWLRLR